jgi:hypothetical protein
MKSRLLSRWGMSGLVRVIKKMIAVLLPGIDSSDYNIRQDKAAAADML